MKLSSPELSTGTLEPATTDTNAFSEAVFTQIHVANGRWTAWRNLLAVRMKELKREPEVIFWVFVFPLLLAAVLGYAFRDSEFEALVAGPGFRPVGGSRYIDFLIPGLLGMTLMNSGIWGIGFAIVEMRQRRLLKRFVATPMRASDFLLALSASRVLLVLAEIVLLLGFGAAVFGTRVVGSIGSVIVVASAGGACFAALALLVACRAEKIETLSGMANTALLGMWMFSGVFFSYQRFPAGLQRTIAVTPLALVNDALRAIICEGASLQLQLHRIALLLVWSAVSFALALKCFRWT